MSGATVRAEVIASMRGIGMSTRAIASAVGVDAKTVRTDLAEPGGEFSPPAVPPARKEPMSMPTAESAKPAPAPLGTPVPIVTGTDGKTYAAAAPQPKRAKKQTNIRGVIADAFFEQMCEMFDNAARRTTGLDIRTPRYRRRSNR